MNRKYAFLLSLIWIVPSAQAAARSDTLAKLELASLVGPEQGSFEKVAAAAGHWADGNAAGPAVASANAGSLGVTGLSLGISDGKAAGAEEPPAVKSKAPLPPLPQSALWGGSLVLGTLAIALPMMGGAGLLLGALALGWASYSYFKRGQSKDSNEAAWWGAGAATAWIAVLSAPAAGFGVLILAGLAVWGAVKLFSIKS